MPKRKKSLLIGVWLLVLAGVGIFYTVQSRFDPANEAAAEGSEKDSDNPFGGVPAVVFTTTSSVDVPVSYDFVGTTEASHRVEIRARIQGIIDARHFEEGGLVREGDLLYSIDPAPYEADLRIAEANLEQKRARLELAKRETERLRQLVEEQIISQSEFDREEAGLIEARAALQLARAEVDKAELELSYTEIRAPFTGLIEETYKETGSLVDEGANSLLTEVLRMDPLDVHFRMSESQFREINQALKTGELRLIGGDEPHIELTLVDGVPYAMRGTINFLNPSIDRQTGTVGYRAQIDNAEGELKPGQFVEVELTGFERPATITVPQEAVSQSTAGAYVYVLDGDDTAEMRKVELGDWSGADWIVISGLEAGERIITRGLGRVRAGQPVNATAASEAAAGVPGRPEDHE